MSMENILFSLSSLSICLSFCSGVEYGSSEFSILIGIVWLSFVCSMALMYSFGMEVMSDTSICSDKSFIRHSKIASMAFVSDENFQHEIVVNIQFVSIFFSLMKLHIVVFPDPLWPVIAILAGFS